MRQVLTELHILDFLALADILDVLVNCNLLEHIENCWSPAPQPLFNSKPSQTPECTRNV